jgi:sugar lactone lactonase YvrE
MLTKNQENFSLRAISNERSDCGEGPIWNNATGVMTWVDIAGNKWHQVSLSTPGDTSTKTFKVPTVIGAIVERTRGGYFAAVKEGFGLISESGLYSSDISFLGADERMNDAKADSKGRYWAGSCELGFTPGRGKLHMIDENKVIRTMETGLTLPNGLGWSPDNKSFYFVDSMQHIMWRYDFDLESGNISNRTVLVKFADDGSVPDGMCVANDGSLFVAMWGGYRVEVYTPEGVLKDVIPVPVKQPSSCTFGGKDGRTLIVTSAAGSTDVINEPLNGLPLAIEGLGYSGQESTVYRG